MGITPEQIAEWIKEGHWPPPPGFTLIPQPKPNPERVQTIIDKFLSLLPEDKAEEIRRLL